MRAISLLLIIPAIWISVTTFTEVSGHPWSSNSVTVHRLGAWIERFQKDQNRLPENLAEVRAYAYTFGSVPELYDSYGARLSYQPLTEDAFIVKSFGRDTTENTVFQAHDESYSHGLISPPLGVKGIILNESRLNFFQSSFLEGQISPRGPLVASIRTRFRGDSKRLLIQSQEDSQFFMSSVHDMIDEFLWLPGGYEIIFTAQGSKRYEDGIYYWDLRSNVVKNLLPDLRKKFFPDAEDDRKMLMSLSHSSASPDFVYFFATYAPVDSVMDPMEFYRYHNFYAFNPANKFVAERVTADKDFSIFEYLVQHKSLIDQSSMTQATAAQKDWALLSLSEGKQELLEKWQNFCSNHADSPQLPYALWWLVSIYNDTYREILVQQPEKARTLRNFGLEIAEALSLLPSAPPYLRAFAEHLKKNLLLSKPADYNVVSMNSDDAKNVETKSETDSEPKVVVKVRNSSNESDRDKDREKDKEEIKD